MQIKLTKQNTQIIKNISDNVDVISLYCEFQDMLKCIGYSIPEDLFIDDVYTPTENDYIRLENGNN